MRDKLVAVRDRRDRQKKKFIKTLEAQGTVLHAAKAAGVSRWTVYRWRDDDLVFANQWDEALENAVDVVENSLYRKAVSGDTVCAHRPIYRDRLNIDVEQVQRDIKEAIERIRENPDLLGIKPVLQITE